VYAVNRKGVLGPICDVGWGDVDARVVCRQLGFRTGQAVGGSYFGQTVPNKYAMEDVGCTGMEDYLRDCQYKTHHTCGINHGAGVYCDP